MNALTKRVEVENPALLDWIAKEFEKEKDRGGVQHLQDGMRVTLSLLPARHVWDEETEIDAFFMKEDSILYVSESAFLKALRRGDHLSSGEDVFRAAPGGGFKHLDFQKTCSSIIARSVSFIIAQEEEEAGEGYGFTDSWSEEVIVKNISKRDVSAFGWLKAGASVHTDGDILAGVLSEESWLAKAYASSLALKMLRKRSTDKVKAGIEAVVFSADDEVASKMILLQEPQLRVLGGVETLSAWGRGDVLKSGSSKKLAALCKAEGFESADALSALFVASMDQRDFSSFVQVWPHFDDREESLEKSGAQAAIAGHRSTKAQEGEKTASDNLKTFFKEVDLEELCKLPSSNPGVEEVKVAILNLCKFSEEKKEKLILWLENDESTEVRVLANSMANYASKVLMGKLSATEIGMDMKRMLSAKLLSRLEEINPEEIMTEMGKSKRKP